MNKDIKNSKTKAAAMANATRGRARIFEDKKKTEDVDKEIEEGIKEYEDDKETAS